MAAYKLGYPTQHPILLPGSDIPSSFFLAGLAELTFMNKKYYCCLPTTLP
jgi:hypothetical protein